MTTTTDNITPTLDQAEAAVRDLIAQPATEVGDVLASLRAIIDAREKLSEIDSLLSARRGEIEADLMERHAKEGVDSYSGGGMSVSFNDEAVRVRYDPERWEAIVNWAFRTGNLGIVQRRITDAKIAALVAEGVSLPTGLTLETYCKLNVRRK